MSGDRYIAAAGLSEDTFAHLRLLLRRPRPNARFRWRWSEEHLADLVVVDADSYPGRMARERAAGSGRRCLILNSTQNLRANEVSLPTPLAATALFDVLNQAARRWELPGKLFGAGDNNFNEVVSDLAEPSALGAADSPKPATQPVAVPGLEDLLRLHADKESFNAEDMHLMGDATTEQANRVSQRRWARLSYAGTSAVAKTSHHLPDKPAFPLRNHYWLHDYLGGKLLGGPASYSLPSTPTLALDPKHRTFFSSATYLQELSDYCVTPLAAAEWHVLTTVQLGELRNKQVERPYLHLTWLIHWVHSDGRLFAHLPPSAGFRLRVRPDLDDSSASHPRIIDALMRFGKVHDIARRSVCDPADVIDLINAYDAIGLIETDLPPALGRNKQPFRRHR